MDKGSFGNFVLKIVRSIKYARYLVLDSHANKEIGMQEKGKQFEM